MGLNQGEGCSSWNKGCLGERFFNDKVNRLGNFWGFNYEKEELDVYKGGKFNNGSHEIADLLPLDPFNMESSYEGIGLTGITSLLEDFGLNTLGFKADENEGEEVDFVWTGAMRIHGDARFRLGMNFREGLSGGHGLMDGKTEIMDFSYDEYWNLGDTTTDNDQGGSNDHCDTDGGNPSDAFLLALGYLDLGDLLTVSRVCKSLREAVTGDPLLWRSIDIDHPFCIKITDDALLKLTNRAQGHLHSLTMYHCSKITDPGLNDVLDRNPHLSKLSVLGCARLTADGILSNLKVLKTAGKLRLKYLGVYGLFGMTNQHVEEFKLLTGVDNNKLPTTRKPRFFGPGQLHVTSDDDRTVDVEVCPKCQHIELVYDCPSESCQKKQSASQLCRACTTCINRCLNCGCCLINCDYVEMFTFDLLCLDCWRTPLGPQKGLPFMSETTVVVDGKTYHFYVYR